MKIGRRHTLSRGRTLVADVVSIANKMPMAPLLRHYELLELDQLRRTFRPRIGWTAIFMKAYAIVATRCPELRQIYIPLPFAHIYTHPRNVAIVAITRQVQGESRLYFARFNRPEESSLVKLQDRYEEFRRAPISELRQFRHQDTFASLPWIMRKPVWWLLTNLWPSKRALKMGTFGMSLSCFKSNLGILHLGPSTTILGCDLFAKKGRNRVTMTFDHRIMDGKPATEVLDELDHVLRTEILAELKNLVAGRKATETLSAEQADQAAPFVSAS